MFRLIASFGAYKQPSKVIFSIEIKNKFNIIKGFSSEGKTLFYNILNEAMYKTPGYVVRLEGYSANVYAQPSNSIAFQNLKGEDLEEGSIIVIDEDSVLLKRKDAASILLNTNCFFIIINRDNMKYLPIDCEDIFVLKQDNSQSNYKIFESIYKEQKNNQ